MPFLPSDLRNKLERTLIEARDVAEAGARAALEALAVHHHEPYSHQTPEERKLRNHLRARARQLGDIQSPKGELSIGHLIHECAYEHWHRMLFARFLAENDLLIEPESGVAISLEECEELAKDAKTNLWALAGRYAQTMLPEIFRADDPVLLVPLAREDQLKLEELLDALAKDTFTASDSLGWCYQFWQAERKEEVNKAGNKIGADELPSVTQLFTEDYMVDFLLDNTLGAWHAGKVLAANPNLAENAKSEEELRKAVALPGVPWKYLRFIRQTPPSPSTGEDQGEGETGGPWRPAAGTFYDWPKTAKELKCLDPCMGSGHFVVAMFERLVALRMAEEKLDEAAAVAAVIRDNLFGLEIDPRCTQIGAFNLALAAWRRVGHRPLPAMNLACSGLAPNAREADWLKIAGDNQKLQGGMERLYRLFQKAAVLGSLINPRAGEGDLLVAAFHELQPLLEKALAQEAKDDTAHEMAVTARGLAKAAEILAGRFTLVATNVPYLTVSKHEDFLRDFGQRCYPDSRHDLATIFVERCLSFALTTAVVTPQNWLFLPRYKKLRQTFLKAETWHFASRLGPGAFETISGEVVKAALVGISHRAPSCDCFFVGIDVSEMPTPGEKATALLQKPLQQRAQAEQLRNPDARIVLQDVDTENLLMVYANSRHGLRTADGFRFLRSFWELPHFEGGWSPEQGTVEQTIDFGGREQVVLWEDGQGALREFADQGLASLQGGDAWGKQGLTVSLIGDLPVTRYAGDFFDNNCAALWPRDPNDLAAVWAFCSSPEFAEQVRVIDQQLKVTSATLLKVPFDLEQWQKVAAQKYPEGLPKPFSSDPTQWLFNGHPKGSDQPLHVAVTRLLGYQWPRQTGSSFPDCPALGPDGLEKLADDDGIVCLPSVRGEEPAAERLRKLLAVAFGKDWKAQTELELIRATGSDAADLEEWLRNDFYEQHCDLFHQRPFLWHIWDGRKRDGFHALVNYHKLAEGEGKGRKLLETLNYSYLGEWISRQQDSVKRGEDGAEDRLAAARELRKRLVAVLEGEPPFDIFVRWKPFHEQPIGWEPDINDGVRLNIRPFMASGLPNGRAGAGILRWKPNIKWEKDRGKEPHRPKSDFPWFWGWDGKIDFMGGKEFTGERFNDCHYTIAAKQQARDSHKK